MKSHLVFISTIFLFLAVAFGCSGGRLSPTSSDLSQRQPLEIGSLPIGVSDWNGTTPTGGMGALGLFSLRIDPAKVAAELSSLRESALTDTVEVVDITNFLTMAPCTHCVKIKSVALDTDGNIIVSIGLRHPFNVGDPFKPITGRNRADLHVFNIEGTVISNAPATSFPGAGQSVAGFKLINADGYTGYLDDVIDEFYPTDATIHPYVLHFDDYSAGNFDPVNPMGFVSVTDPPPTGNLVMAMGCDYNFQDYVFSLDQPFDFIYAVGCTYAVSSATKSQRFTPEYRIPQHNKKAASEVKFTITSNDLKAGDTASTAEIEIHVVDINHNVDVGDALNQMLSNSSVSRITVDVPSLMTTPLAIMGNSSISGTGHSPADPLIYQATIRNTTGADMGTYPGLIKVLDSYAPGQNTSPLLSAMDGIERVDPLLNPLTGLFTIPEFATYQAFSIAIEDISCDPPIPTAINPNIFATNEIYTDVVINGNFFTGSGGVTDVYLDNGTAQYHATNINVVDDTQLTCDFTFSHGVADTYDVVVFTACEGRGIDLAQLSPEEWSCYQYNSTNIGRNSIPQNFDPSSYTQKWFTPDNGLHYSGPAITKDYVYVAANDSFYATALYHRLTCFDINTGTIKWQKFIDPTADYARAHTSPVWFDDGSDGRVAIGGDRVWCFDAITGATEWEYGQTYIFIGSSPKFWDNKIFIAGNGMMHCIDAMTGAQVWDPVPGVAGSESTCAVTNGKVYLGAGSDPNGTFTCIDVPTGTITWQTTGLSSVSHWDAPLVIDGRIYYASYQQKLTCLDAGTGSKIWQFTEATSDAWITACTTWVDPSDNKRVIYFGGAFSGGIYAIKDMGATPLKLWRSATFYCDSSPVYNNGIVYAGVVGGQGLRGFDPVTGAQVFTLSSITSDIRSAVGFAYDNLIVVSSSGVYCFK